jgi:hypothetical protein
MLRRIDGGTRQPSPCALSRNYFFLLAEFPLRASEISSFVLPV